MSPTDNARVRSIYRRLEADLDRDPHDEVAAAALAEVAGILAYDGSARDALLARWIEKHVDPGVDRPLTKESER